MYACMHACMHACMYVCMYVCIDRKKYIYIYIYSERERERERERELYIYRCIWFRLCVVRDGGSLRGETVWVQSPIQS